MNRRFLIRAITLIAMLGLAVTSLLLLFLLLGRSVGATSKRASTIPDAQARSVTFTVSGTVTCEGVGPVPDAEVFVWDREGTGGFSIFTDSSGYYSVTMTGGHYDLNFHPPCGSECASKAHKGITGPPDLTLNVVLTRGYTVSGTVFATDGTTPVGNVSIYVFNHDTADGFGLPLTGADGHYCVSLAEGYDDLSFTPPVCLGLGSQAGIIVTQSMTRDVTLPPGFAVGGCVTDRIGNPVPGVQIYAYDPTPGIGGFGFAPTNEMGCYTGTLPLGTFDIQFIPPPGRCFGSITVVDVVSETGGCPNTWLPITLPAGFTVSGQVTCQGQPVKNVYVYASPVEGGAPDDDLGGWGLYTVDDGSYRLPLVSGTYDIKFIPPLATGLNARAFTTIELTTGTVVNVDFCVCSGVWVSETVDSAGNVGGDNSLALATTYPYTPHISYRDYITSATYNLKHAWLSGTTWLSETVDSGGERTSLALEPGHHSPFIIHHHWGEWDLKYACHDGASWNTGIVIGSIRAKNGSLALEPSYPYTPHVSYYVPWGTVRTLDHAYLSGTTWCSGTWVREHVEPPLSEAGGHSSLALESSPPYTPHISYLDSPENDLKHAWKSGTTWLSETVDSGGDVGAHNSLALDSSGNPHIAYFDATNVAVKYAWLSDTTWLSETVDSIAQPDSHWRPISLDLDQADAPYISYYDANNGDLKLAYFNGTVWITQTVDSAGMRDQFTSLALDQAGCPCISYYDSTNKDLKYACLLPVPKVYFPIIMRDY